jgi:hypothetical protein
MNRPFWITTPGGRVTTGSLVMRVPLELGSKVVPANLFALSLEGIDVILGMDWLIQHQVVLDIATRMVEIHSPYQWSNHLVLAQGGRHRSLFLCCRNRPARKHPSSV